MKVSLKRVGGLFLILSPFVVLFLVLVTKIGLMKAGMIFAFSISASLILMLGAFLVTSED